MTAVAIGDRTSAPARGGTWTRQGVILAAFVGCALAAFSPAASALQYAVPLGAGAAAAYCIATGRTAFYMSLCFWLFMLAPFLRRLVDLQIGFTEGNLILAAPYAACAAAFLAAPSYFLSRNQPGQIAIAAVMLTATYGLALAVFAGKVAPGVYDWLRWTAPAAFAAYLIFRSDKGREIADDVRTIALIALPLLSAYALLQFAAPQAWDRLWMAGSHLTTIGAPEPFEVRVFGTLNSPGSFSLYIVCLMLLALAGKTPVKFAGLIAGLVALGVTLSRTGWFALVVGLVMTLIRGTWRARLVVIGTALAALVAMPLIMLTPQLARPIAARLETVSLIGQDQSFLERVRAYGASLGELAERPFGQGLALTGAYQGFGDGAARRFIDGGPIEILLALGVLGGAIYLAAIGALMFTALTRAPVLDRSLAASCAAMVAALGAALVAATTTVGEIGFLFWLCCALLLLRQPQALSAAPSARPTAWRGR